MIKLCAKFDRSRTICGTVIDDLAKFCRHYITLWPWPIPLDLDRFVVDWASRGQKSSPKVGEIEQFAAELLVI